MRISLIFLMPLLVVAGQLAPAATPAAPAGTPPSAAAAAARPAPAGAQPGAPKDQGDRSAGLPHASRSPVLGRNGMAATSQPLATQIAIDVLKRGGNAVDAAIAATAAMGVLEPLMAGAGGDLFAIVWDPKTKRLHGLNASGRAPRALTLARQQQLADGDGRMSWVGWPPVTIPGGVDGWFALHERFARLPMKTLLAPSIEYAEAGVPVTQEIAQQWARGVATVERQSQGNPYIDLANWRRVFIPGGQAPRHGDVFRNPDLARTYRLLASDGRDAYYEGPIAKGIVQYLQKLGAPHTLADFAAQHSEWVTPVGIRYRGYDVYEIPPPGQGIATLQMLKLLEGFDLKALGRGNPEFWHLLVEAKKVAFADRAALYGDVPDVPVAKLLSDEYSTTRRALIDPRRASVQVDAGLRSPGNTNYLTVADKDGMMVSLIQSNAGATGSALVPDDGAGRPFGFVLQNRGAAFSLKPGSPNTYAPGKRPHHTIIPAMVMKDGAPYFAFGALGGDMQPQAQVQILVNLIDFGMDVQAAGDAARVMHVGSAEPDGEPAFPQGGIVYVEGGVPERIAMALRERGHQVGRDSRLFYGGYQGILRDPRTGVYWGASEFRTDGQAAGY
jgi:gamma-glutamyltranspeptidase / glutathione hydrolase